VTTFTRRQLYAIWQIARGLTHTWAMILSEPELIFAEATEPTTEEDRQEHNSRFWGGESPWTDERIKQETLARNILTNHEIDLDLAPSPTFAYHSHGMLVAVGVNHTGEISIDVSDKIVFRAESWLAASITFLNWDCMNSTQLPGWTLLRPQPHLLSHGDLTMMFADDATNVELAELGRVLSGFGNEHVRYFIGQMNCLTRLIA
jgi:hypothetical protein